MKKSNDMTSLQAFAEARRLRKLRMKTRNSMLGSGRKGYSIVPIQGEHMITYQICIYLKNTETLAEAERNAKNAIKILRNRLGPIV